MGALMGMTTPTRRTATVGVGVILFLAALIGAWRLTGGGSGGDLPTYWEAPDFALIDQNRDTLRAGDLRGTPWIASFVFTNCESVCPLITRRMAELRDRLDREGLLGREVRLVSFTVDPERDTPEVLRRYARDFGASPPGEWAFLTSASGAEMRRMIQNGFRVSAVHPDVRDPEPDSGDADGEAYQIAHSPHVLLLDETAVVRGIYDATEPDALDEVVRDLDAVRR